LTSSISKTAAILLTVLVGIEGILYFQLQSHYDSLDFSYKELEGELVSLQNQYSELENQYEDLNEEYLSVQASHQNMSRDYNSLRASYQTFREYVSLQGDYEEEREYVVKRESYIIFLTEFCKSLQRDYEIETALRIGNVLESYYDFLRYEKGFIELWRSDYQRDADFAAKLALHDLGRNCWPSIENAYYEDTGKHSYEMAKAKIDEIIGLIGLRAYYAPTFKIKKILEFITQNIHYEDEFNNLYLAPTETLGFRSGDCDDFSILASALFEAVGIDSSFGILKNADDEYHCVVLVHLKDLKNYCYSSYSDLTPRGLDEGKWIVIEPQYTIDHQDSDWIEKSSLVAVSPLD